MPNYARLILQSYGSEGLAVLNYDTQAQVLISSARPAQELIADCIALTATDKQSLKEGYAIAASMDAETWALWNQAHFANFQDSHVWLTICQEDSKAFPECISAVNILTKKEIICMDDRDAFIRDCKGWHEPTFLNDSSFVVTMRPDLWEQWLEMYEPLNDADLGDLFSAA